MRFGFSTLAFAASLVLVNAQDLSGLPTCALTCFATAVPDAGCSLTDTKCQCTTGQAKITSDITSCVPGKCSTDDIAKIAPAVEAICKRAGVTVTNIPTAVSTGGSASNTASVTGSTTQTATGAAQSTGAAVANVANVGVFALGLAAAWL